MSALYILDTNLLSDRWFANTFSDSVFCFFISLMVSFAVQKLFSLRKSHLFTFAFVTFYFGVKPKKSLTRPMSRSLSSVFFLLENSGLTLKSSIHLSLFLCIVWDGPISFTCDCPVFPTPFIEYVFLIVYSWLVCCKSVDYIWMGSFLCYPFYFYDYGLEVRKHCFQLCSFLRLLWQLWVCHGSIQSLRLSVLFLWEMLLEFW